MIRPRAPRVVARLVDRAKKDPDVLAVLLFGTHLNPHARFER